VIRAVVDPGVLSGDRDLLEANIGDVEILTPRAFIDRLDTSEG
jgi:hypothetical protein